MIAALEHDETRLRAVFRDTDEAFVNMVKRAANEIPAPACASVTFHKNTSCFCDEILAHRFGMIPFRATAEATLHLHARGPRIVRTSDIAGDESARPAHADLLVVALGPDEELHVDLHVRFGTGRDHARHSAVVAPRCVHRHVGFGGRRPTRLDEPPPLECFCDDTRWGETCVECAGTKRDVALASAPMEYHLEFETTGAMPPLDVLRAALLHLRSECVQVARQIHAAA